MRKIGIYVAHWATRWSDDSLPFIARAHAAGYDGAEIGIGDPAAMDTAGLRAEADRLGMGITTGIGLTPDTDITSPDAAIRQAGLKRLRDCLEISQRLGASVMGGVTFAAWNYFPDSFDLGPYRERCAASLHEAGKIAGDLGVTLGLEVLNRFETPIFNTVEQGLELLEQVDSPHVKLHLDTFHMNIEEDDLGAAIRMAGDRLGHFHCAASSRKMPGHGHIPWADVKQALDDINYQEWLVIETFLHSGGEVGATIKTWRDLGGDPDEEARAGADFIREHVA
jgi:D-psicose/D-tagatose/L-ribulose 3-epimerase